jgi:hypothetical protein
MNCDIAFDLMTSADRRDDPGLLRHLEHCPRCRQMQDTLSPALDWLSDSSVANWPQQPPATSGTAPLLSLQAVRIAESAARELSLRQALSAPATFRRALSVAIVLLFGIALGVAGFETRPPAPDPGPTVSGQLVAACLWTDAETRGRQVVSTSQAVVASCIACHVPPTVR